MLEETEHEVGHQPSAEELLLEWRTRYGYIYVAELEDNLFVYRLLAYDEYEHLRQQAQDPLELDEWVCRTCVLDPQILDWDDGIYAGYTTSLSRTILEQSLLIGSDDPELQLEQMIAQREFELDRSLVGQFPLIINHCFPEYTLERLSRTPVPELIDLYVKAKWVLKNIKHVDLQFQKEEG